MSEAEVPEADSPTSSVDPSASGGCIDDAIVAIREQRRRLEHERRAYLEFTRRLRDIEMNLVDAPHAAAAGPESFQDIPRDNGAGVRAVTRPYRETVMSVPHVEEVDDESLAVHMAAELGQGVTMAFFQNGQLSPQIRQALIAQAENASRRRSTVLDSIESEVDRLAEFVSAFQSIRNELAEITRDLPSASFDDLIARYDDVVELEARIGEVLADRQEAIHGREPVVHRYLYAELDVSHPVLSEGAALTGLLEDVERLVVRYLAARA